MASNPYVVVRLVPESAVDGPTFATYLDGLRLQLVDAYTGAPLSDYVYSSPLILGPNGTGSGAVVSLMTSDAAKFVAANDYGNTLTFDAADAVSVGSFVFTADQTTIPPASNLTVIEAVEGVDEGVVTLSGNLPNYVPAGTVVMFVPAFVPGTTVVTDPAAPAPTFTAGSNGPVTTATDVTVVPMANVDGVLVGMGVTGAGIPAGATVAGVEAAAPASITLSLAVAGGVTNVGPTLTFKWPVPFLTFSLTPTTNTANTLTFPSAKGVGVGMTLTPAPGLIAPGTTVTDATATVVTLSKNLLGNPTTPVTFNLQLSSGIAQQTEVETTINFLNISTVIAPVAVATAVIPLNSPPTYVNVRVVAIRDSRTLPINQTFYNVVCESSTLPDPSQYQNIPGNQTSFYLSLPPPPLKVFVPLKVPSDGSPPDFDDLIGAIQNALANEPTLPQDPQLLVSSPANCQRIAYDIVWSYQNTLPEPPDALQDMYTNPPNPGGSNAGQNQQNNLEQDRIKFEGTLNSFYSTRNAEAERLAKFVAAASAALYCETTSLNSTSALLDFPVDPSSSFEKAVESELRVQGLGLGSSSGLPFGVPAAYFYALGASHDKSATPAQRFQTATGDAIERLLHEFTVALDAGTIGQTEPFSTPAALSLPRISPFQAARRLVALRASPASTTPMVTAYAGTPLAAIVADWLGAGDPTPAPPPNPAPAYDTVDFAIWVKALDVSDPKGYLYIDLDALTQGYVIPSFTANVSAPAGGGSTLTFAGGGTGIAAGMPVSGTNIAPGTLVSQAAVNTAGGVTTVTLDTPVTGGIAQGAALQFNAGVSPVLLATTVDCPNGNVLTFAGTAGVSVGMGVYGPNIPAQTKVTNVGATTVMLSNAVTGDVPKNSTIAFAILASTLADQIFNWLPSTASPAAPQTIDTLKKVRSLQWTSLFTVLGNQQWLPPFTQPVRPGASTNVSAPAGGYTALRIRAFVRAVQQFFEISSAGTTAQPAAPGVPPTFKLPQFKPISDAVSLLPGNFSFTDALNPSDLATAVQTVFPSDVAAQKWLTQAMTAISELYRVASGVPDPTGLPNPVSLKFPVVEAMYARGFRSASDITRLSAAEFQQALAGTVAYDFANSGANSLYPNATTIAPPEVAPPADEGSFEPINPDGALVNCVPPPCLSPTSPIAYLLEMLLLSQSATCENPGAPPLEQQLTLGQAVQARRGPLGNLLASCANLETPLPSIDIVNECLEYLAATLPPAGNSTAVSAHGTVYDTSADEVAGHWLCRRGECARHQEGCHEPAAFFAALPEYSTPATPGAANQAVEPAAFDNLRADFSSCELPYSQALDVSRTYLGHLGSCRFEELRTFRKCITEFALSPAQAPDGFPSHLWRYPVRIETAIEYLGISMEEYASVFSGTAPQACAAVVDKPGAPHPVDRSRVRPDWRGTVELSDFLKAFCLSYCDFLDFAKLGLVQVQCAEGDQGADERKGEGGGGATGGTPTLPECEPCCLENYEVVIPTGDENHDPLLVVCAFLRLWKKLQHVCGARYTFAELSDIGSVLHFVDATGALNPEFIRQLAAFQMLRDQFELPLRDPGPSSAGQTGADRTHLLALWVGSGAAKWDWAVHQLVEGVTTHARRHYGCGRLAEFAVRAAQDLDALSRLAGFRPPTATSPSTDTWNSSPGCTLRFAEVLAKMAGSGFELGELLYLFNAKSPDHCESPFPEQDSADALIDPFGLPDDEPEHSLWRLRQELLAVEVTEDEACAWTWPRICSELRDKFGYAPVAGSDPLLSVGQHFFPHVLGASGYPAGVEQRHYRVALTSSTDWNSVPHSPFHYDASASELRVQLPLRDAAVAAALSRTPQLNPTEQAAVQDLYFAPRLDLAPLAFLFPDWSSAQRNLIEEPEEERRWAHFRRHFALADARRRRIAEHLAAHVRHAARCDRDDLSEVAALVLSRLLADENGGTPWESDSGVLPAVMWGPAPSGGAIAALLGAAGTGLLGEYYPALPVGCAEPPSAAAGTTPEPLWRDVRGPLRAFGHEGDETNAPVPTVLPALALPLASSTLVDVQDGYADESRTGRPLGGAEGFRVRWSGALLVEHEGEYEFHAGAPTPDGERPDFECARRSQWRLTLHRGQKAHTVLHHDWPGDAFHARHSLPLRPGAYDIVVEYNQPSPRFEEHHVRPSRTGFEVKYAGPDTDGRLIPLPLSHLYRERKDSTLDQGIQFLDGSHNAQAFLKAFYTGTLRDVRRTYQRAFKAVLFAGKLGLSARRNDARQSELGYMLANPALFAGYAYYRNGAGAFTRHLANFDFNFLPLRDSYEPPTPAPPDRSSPSLQRTQAMVDWWERLFDYGRLRDGVRRAPMGPVWHLFEEARTLHLTDPAPLLRHIDAQQACWALDLSFYQDQSAPFYAVSSTDLSDDRWLVRVWHADRWMRRLLRTFHSKDIAAARPAAWAAQDPGAALPASGMTDTGNANLSAFVADGCLESGEPRRYHELKRLNDGLRERGRRALIAYLCSSERVPLAWKPATAFAASAEDLSDLLLLDVKAGPSERSSRIEDAISAVQTFVRRARLGLEPGWKVGHSFARLWESRFESYHVWERCKRREIYKENWIEWSELTRARRIEAFRFLESQLQNSTLTLAAPGGLQWWADTDRALERYPELIQRRVPSELHLLKAPPQSATREGLATLGVPERADATTWLAMVPGSSSTLSTPTGKTPGTPATAAPATRAKATADAGATPELPFWLESAMKLGTRFVRVAAAGVPPAGLGFAPHADSGRSSCCHECGREHPMLVDEYYFWLVDAKFYEYDDDTDAQDGTDASFNGSYQFGFQDSFYDDYQQQSAEWHDEEQVPRLLAKWQPRRGVRLAWCRVHNKQFQQPRRSVGYVAISPPADLIFLGRAGDSLFFSVSGAAPLPPGYGDDSSPPGFRFDLPSDQAVVLPEITKPALPPSPSPYPGGLISYPFFAYDEPGARLFPASWFSPALLVGGALRDHCRFDVALKWYQRAFDPLQGDCTWMDCEVQDDGQGADAKRKREAAPKKPDEGDADCGSAACCDATQITDAQARKRAVTLEFCRTLLDWGHDVMRRRAPEAFRQARVLFDTAARIAGAPPKSILLPEPAQPASVSQFVPEFAPLNPRLMDLYATITDRLALVQNCLDDKRLETHGEGGYFGDHSRSEEPRTARGPCDEEDGCCCVHSPYRFTFQVQRALELAGKVRELGGQLLAAYEKGDAEILAAIRAEQERELLALALPIRQDQWRDADWQVQALQQSKDSNQASLTYYTNMYENGLINDELQNLTLSTNAMQTRTGANVIGAVGETMTIVPDFFVGAMSTFSQIPIGTKLAGLFNAISKFMLVAADIQSATAAIDMTQAGWDRRSAEWFHQMQILPAEIHQIELQILGAQRRRDQAMHELNNQQRQLENATEVQDFLRDKFTATELYLHLRRQTSGLHAAMYRLARCAALEAERAFNFERGHTRRRFVPADTWDTLHEGLMAGERLEAALHHMQQSYFDENVREYELTKHFSLRLHFPQEFIRLKTTGYCEIDVPEWMYDVDFPGHYMRRYKGLRVTVPVVSGPYTGVHCRVTLLQSQTRIDPRLERPAARCCCDGRSGDGYEACPHDPRLVHSYGAMEAIASSSGQNDSGLFELNFRDERRLPFEFHGAVCRLRIELPPENNYFSMETLTDFVLQVDYTAREGGAVLRRAASEAARRRLPGSGWCLLDVRNEFPDAWARLRRGREDGDPRPTLNVRLERRMFPFIPGTCGLSVDRVAVFLSMCEGGCEEHSAMGACPCPVDARRGSHLIEVDHGARQRDCEPLGVVCAEIGECPDLYAGVFDAALGPLEGSWDRRSSDRHAELRIQFAADVGEIGNVYLLCRYEPHERSTGEPAGAGGKPLHDCLAPPRRANRMAP